MTSIDPKNQIIELQSAKSMNYDILILATGSRPNKFGWPGQNLNGVQGLYSFPDLQNMEKFTKGIQIIESNVIIKDSLF